MEREGEYFSAPQDPNVITFMARGRTGKNKSNIIVTLDKGGHLRADDTNNPEFWLETEVPVHHLLSRKSLKLLGIDGKGADDTEDTEGKDEGTGKEEESSDPDLSPKSEDGFTGLATKKTAYTSKVVPSLSVIRGPVIRGPRPHMKYATRFSSRDRDSCGFFD